MQDFETLDTSPYLNHNQREADKSLAVRFFIKPVRNEAKSNEANRPIFDEVEYVEILTPGAKNQVFCGPVRQSDRERFEPIYKRFKERGESIQEGTPLSEWSHISNGIAEELKHFKCFTVEQLAALSDTSLQGLGTGYTALREKARAYLAQAKDGGTAERQAAQIAQILAEMEVLKAKNAELEMALKEAQTKRK